jgi:hypothetical protein
MQQKGSLAARLNDRCLLPGTSPNRTAAAQKNVSMNLTKMDYTAVHANTRPGA